MLEKLGNAFRKTVDKVANTLFLDKRLVESIVKELQRALIEADVNLALVSQLTEKIRKIAYDERVKSIEKKEHLIKILYDELSAIVGKSEEIKIKGKTKIMLLGLYGSGKCVHADTKIQLSNGNIRKAKELYESYSHLNKEELEDGFIIDISDKNLTAPSFNPSTLKIEDKKITHLWKLKKDELYHIYLDNGNDFSIKVTPEHPFFVLRNGRIIKIRADEIKESDYIAAPTDIKIEGKTISLKEKLKQLQLKVKLQKEEIEQILKNKNQTIKEIHKTLKQKVNYCHLTIDLKNNKIPIELVDNLSNFILLKDKEALKFITIPSYLTSDFAEFIGYVIGDGNIRKRYIQISSEDLEIISRIKELSNILFNIEPKINLAKRTKKMYNIRICSTTLVKILSIFGLNPGKKGRQLKIPEEILQSNNETVKAFIKAYFDCDSSPSKSRYIELTSESQTLIEQMGMLLRRLGIISAISKKQVNNVSYWRLSIKARYAEKYADKIGYLIKHKRERIDNYHNIGIIQGCGNQDMIPIGQFLKETRKLLGFSIGEIQENAVYSYGIYEEKGLVSKEKLKQLIAYYTLKKKGTYMQFLEDIENKINLKEKYGNGFLNGIKNYLNEIHLIEAKENSINLTNTGQVYLQKMKETNNEEIINILSKIANSEVSWLPINKINKIKNDEEFVYDLTVEDNHSFIAEGFIIHNTTTIAKLANYYGKRGHKTCMLGLDVHRPAAPEQLEQLGKQVNIPVFVDKNEKSALKIWKKFEPELKDYDLILIDTAGRHSLDEELINEIKQLNEKIKPDYLILVLQADIGQAAKKQASEFQKACRISGVIITRMDSTAKAGGVLSACSETKTPVFFIGVGEKINEIETFNPESFISRILGMGDLKTLLDKVNSAIGEKQGKKLKEKLEEGKFTLKDLQSQLEAMQNMGPLSKIAELIPGFSSAKLPENLLSSQEDKLKKWKHAINSMTKEEVENPELLEKETSRLGRIAKGSGTSTSDIRALIKQYKLLTEFMKTGEKIDMEKGVQGLSQKQLQKFAKKFKGKIKL